ncbi:MAG: ABC transporter ATP-binding protein [Eubacteriales bacterium]
MSVIHVENLSLTLPEATEPLFEAVTFHVEAGETVALTGLSGTGKSLIAKCVAGIVPDFTKLDMKGKICLLGKEQLSHEERVEQVGYIFQNPDHQLFASVVEMELAFGPENLCLPPEEIDRRITKVLGDMHMEAYRYHNPAHLSGGQKQLIAIASVLTLEPSILICDEILSQLDQDSCELVLSILRMLRAQGNTIFMIEHDLSKVDFLDRIYELKGGKVLLHPS